MLSTAERENFSSAFTETISETVRNWPLYALGFDVRSLALLRIVGSLAYLWDLVCTWPLLESCYSDAGMLPRAFIFQNGLHGVSLYLACGTVLGVKLLFLLHMAAVTCVMLGYRTSIAAIVSWVFVISLQNRFPYLPGWETEIRSFFLIGCFLPWSERASLDNLLARRRGVIAARYSNWVVSFATVAWRTQIVALYLCSGLWKEGLGWGDGTAVEISLASDNYKTWFGTHFLALCHHLPGSLIFLNYAVPMFEVFAALWLLSPWPLVQFTSVVGLWCLETGFGLCLAIGNFSLICSACLLGFIPSVFWSPFEPRQPTKEVARPPLRFWQAALLTWVAASITVSAVDAIPGKARTVTSLAEEPWLVTGLDQHWGMFVPPPYEGVWHVIKGKSVRGEWVDLLQCKRGVSSDPPQWIHNYYPSVRVYLFLGLYLHEPVPHYKYLVQSIGDYYRRHWERLNPSAAERIRDVTIQTFERRYDPKTGYGPIKSSIILEHHYN